MSVIDLLLSAQNPDPQVRNSAETVIYRARDDNLASFLQEMVKVARDESVPGEARQMALLLLKNTVAFNAKEEQRKKELESRWQSIHPDMRANVRQEVLNTLGSGNKDVRHVAASVVANLARMELPRNEWPTLLNSLFEASKSDQFMEAAITTLGYICEESNTSEALGEVLQHHSNKILECVMAGMRHANPEVCYQSTNAMCNSITFIHGNMYAENERNYIMSTVCSNCVDHEPRTIVKSLECLVRIAAEYYDVLLAYMETLFQITTGAINSSQEDCALQGFQFWSTICEVELEVLEDDGDCQNYAAGGAQHLLPVALQALLKQEEFQTDEDWNVSAAGGVCLQRFAQVLRNDVLQHVMPFVEGNVGQQNWRNREAGVMAFGCILDGPDTNSLGRVISQALPALLSYVDANQHPLVRDSTVWVIARIANFHAEVVLSQFLDDVVRTAATLMSDIPPIANKACSIIHNLCVELEEDESPQTNPMSQYFTRLVETLIRCVDRPNAHENNLRGAAQETLNSLLSCAATDTFQQIASLIPEFVNRIDRSFSLIRPENSAGQMQEIQLMQGLMCGSLQHICRKLGPGLTELQATSMMTAFQKVLNQSHGTVQEEALMAVGAIASAIGPAFIRFLEGMAPYIYGGLKSTDMGHICNVTVGTVGDIMSALGQDTPVPFCDEVMTILLANIRSDEIARNTRPPIISCFGDIALHSGEKFEKYLQVVMGVLDSAAGIITEIDPEDDEMVEFGVELKESICEAYTGILQGFKDSPNFLVPYVPRILNFIGRNGTDKDVEDVILRNCVSVAGDILNVFGQPQFRSICPQSIQEFVRDEQIQAMVTRASSSNNEDTRETASWAKEQAREYL
jgi:importin subunit beta-1